MSRHYAIYCEKGPHLVLVQRDPEAILFGWVTVPDEAEEVLVDGVGWDKGRKAPAIKLPTHPDPLPALDLYWKAKSEELGLIWTPVPHEGKPQASVAEAF